MRRNKTVFIFILILLFNIPIVYSASNEGYGEDEQALGQFVDSFENGDNISVSHNIIVNTTLDCAELNTSEAEVVIFADDFEDATLDAWTSSNNWAVSTSWEKTGSYGARGLGSNSLLNKDLGIQISGSDIRFSVWIRPVTYRSYIFIREIATCVYIYHRADTNTFYHYTGSPRTIATSCPEGNWYKIWVDDIDFATDTFDVYIYDAGLNLKGSLNDVAFTTVASYFAYVGFQAGTGTSGQVWIDDVNLTQGGVSSIEGYFTTVDYLNDSSVNGSALVQMTNTTIPVNTVITVEFSEDNITWVLNDWQPIFGGFESIDLRELNYSSAFYIRYNLSTTDTTVTPRIYQSRLITSIGNSTGVGGPVVGGGINSSSILFVIFLLIIGFTLLYGVYRRK